MDNGNYDAERRASRGLTAGATRTVLGPACRSRELFALGADVSKEGIVGVRECLDTIGQQFVGHHVHVDTDLL